MFESLKNGEKPNCVYTDATCTANFSKEIH